MNTSDIYFKSDELEKLTADIAEKEPGGRKFQEKVYDTAIIKRFLGNFHGK